MSLVDAFALALASHQGWSLLTEDRAMRSVADSKGIAHRDALWIIDNLLDAGILSKSQVVASLEAMRDDPRCPVPKSQVGCSHTAIGWLSRDSRLYTV